MITWKNLKGEPVHVSHVGQVYAIREEKVRVLEILGWETIPFAYIIKREGIGKVALSVWDFENSRKLLGDALVDASPENKLRAQQLELRQKAPKISFSCEVY